MATFKDILVHVDNRPACAQRLAVATQLAVDYEAHITGLYVIPHYPIPTYAEVQIPESVRKAEEKQALATADEARARFDKAVAQAGCAGEWRCERGFADRYLGESARYADLVVMGAPDRTFGGGDDSLVDHMIVGSARPIMFVPEGFSASTTGQRILVAWNAKREAVRAIHDAMPMLERARDVDVVAIRPPSGEGDIPTADICRHLARHGVHADGDDLAASDIDVGDALLARAAERDRDLIVMGGYGHTRLRETILGGVTKHMLGSMTVPVFMSH